MAEVARMAANSNLRIDITSFPAQTVRAPLTTARSIDGGCGRPTGRTRLDASRDAPVRRRQLHPPTTATKQPRPAATCQTGRGATPIPISAGSTASATASPKTTIAAVARPAGAGATSSLTSASAPGPRLHCAEIAVLPFLAVLHTHAAVLQVTAPPC